METKNPPEFVDDKLADLRFVSKVHVPPHCPGGGGLTLLWNTTINVNVLFLCDNFIDSEIEYKNKKFFATFTYGAPEQAKRTEVLNKRTKLLTGDFNDIIDNSEKEGGPVRAEGPFIDFRTFMSQCDLYDLRHSGNHLSWRGVRHTHTVHCKLDRAMSNSLWQKCSRRAEALISTLVDQIRSQTCDHVLRYDRKF